MTDMDSENPVLEKDDANIEEWNDQRCFIISRLDTFPEIVKDTNIQKTIISRFLNFYLGGKCQKGLSATDLLYAVISIMPAKLDSEELIWDDKHYSEKGTLFFLTPDNKLKVDIENLISKRAVEAKEIPSEYEQLVHEINGEVYLDNNKTEQNDENAMESSDGSHSSGEVDETNSSTDTSNKSENDSCSLTSGLRWFRQKYDVKPNVTNEEYSPVSNATFCINCNRLLDQWTSSIEARNSLKYFFAMAALIAMRGRAKSYQTITKYFSTLFFKSLFPNKIETYTPPHRGFIKRSWKALHEPDIGMQIMFSKLVINSFVEHEKMLAYGKHNILSFAILSHTANYGMGIISMLQLLAAKTNCNFDRVFKSLYSEEVAASWNRVNDFFKKYLYKSAKQYTFHWARIIERDQFEYLSCSNNYGLAVVIAVYIEKITNDSGIWRSAWVANEHLDKYKDLGLKMYINFKETIKMSSLEMQFIRYDILKIVESLMK